MKWNHNGIKYLRGCYECLICRFDTSEHWFAIRAMATQQTQKVDFKILGEYLHASSCEVKLQWLDENTESENDILYFDIRYDGTIHFYRIVDGHFEKIDL